MTLNFCKDKLKYTRAQCFLYICASQVGDVVEWSWMTPLGVSDVKYTVQQTDDIDSKSHTENGFGRTKPPTSAGSYSYQFTEEGMFYYWSGPVNPSGMIQ